MVKDKIISDLYTSKEFNDCIRKMEPRHLQEDLKSEVMLVLCEKEPELIEDLHAKGELKYYAVKIILNMIKSSESRFYRQFRRDNKQPFSSEEIYGVNDKTIIIADRLIEEKKNELRMMEVFNLFWYDKEMILLYLEHGNYRAIEDETTIEHTSVFKTIKKAIKKIDAAVEMRMLRYVPYEFGELVDYILRADRRQAIEYLYNVLHYFEKEYGNPPLIEEIKRRAKEREDKLKEQELKPNAA